MSLKRNLFVVIFLFNGAVTASAQHRDTVGLPYPYPAEFMLSRPGTNPRWPPAGALKSNPGEVNISATTSATSKLPLGYTHEKWDPQIQSYTPVMSKVIAYESKNVFESYLIVSQDTVQIDEISMADDYKYADIVDFLLPVIDNYFYLRPVRGMFYGNFVKNLTRKKVGEDFVVVNLHQQREILPFGNRYADHYSLGPCLNNGTSFEYISKGARQDDLWVQERFVTQKNCATNTVVQEWKEILKFDSRGDWIEDISYIKQGSEFITLSQFKRQYDELHRVISSISDNGNRKQIMEYDGDGYLLSDFYWNGTDWIQTIRTVKEILADADNTIVIYKMQQITDGNWIDYLRATLQYDNQSRITGSSTEYFNKSTNVWDLEDYSTIKYYKDNLRKENEFYFLGAGTKFVTEYDSNDKRIQTTIYSCQGQENCANGDYKPLRKTDYSMSETDTLDYLRNWTYSNGMWTKFDSLANVYDMEGNLTEMYHQFFVSGERDRYRVNYENVITSIGPIEQTTFSLYPNPVTDKFTIETSAGKFTIQIYDSNGMLVDTYFNEHVIDFSAQPRGIYIVLIQSGQLIKSCKIFKI